ncbi:MAG: site-specific integrase [Clostridia bacterium]|nr:site-specific integrase [Clostridia bacterium]
MKNKEKDYTTGSYYYKKPRKKKTGKICHTCRDCENKAFCKYRRDPKLMKKCPKCRECFDKQNCDSFYIGVENKTTAKVGVDEETGKAIRKSFNAKSKEEAIYRAVQYKNDISNGVIQPKKVKTKHSVVAIIKEYEQNRFNIGEITACTYFRYNCSIKRFETEEWANKPIKEVTRKQIEDFLAKERDAGYANSVMKKEFSLIKTAFEIAVERGYITQNQNYFLGRYGIKRPKSIKKDKKVKAVELEEQMQFLTFLNTCNLLHRDLFILLLNTGARVGELLGLELEDIHLEENYFWIKRTTTVDDYGKIILGENTKTENGERMVVLNKITKPALERAILNRNPSKENLIFCKKDGTLYSDSGINSALKRAWKMAGLTSDVHVHMFRHTFVTRSKEAGVDVEATKTGVGHGNIHITQDIYNEDQLPYLLEQNKTYANYIIQKSNEYNEKNLKNDA